MQIPVYHSASPGRHKIGSKFILQHESNPTHTVSHKEQFVWSPGSPDVSAMNRPTSAGQTSHLGLN